MNSANTTVRPHWRGENEKTNLSELRSEKGHTHQRQRSDSGIEQSESNHHCSMNFVCFTKHRVDVSWANVGVQISGANCMAYPAASGGKALY